MLADISPTCTASGNLTASVRLFWIVSRCASRSPGANQVRARDRRTTKLRKRDPQAADGSNLERIRLCTKCRTRLAPQSRGIYRPIL